MKTSYLPYLACSSLIVMSLLGCAGGESPATVAEDGRPADAAVEQHPSRDTVDWKAFSSDGQPPWSTDAEREGPGEEMGLIGPIVAMGGSGSKTYVAVYDPGGVFIGALYLEEARQEPRRLENLLRLAHRRGVVQNARAIEQIAARRYLALVQAARQGGTP